MNRNDDDIATIKLIRSSKKHLFAELVDRYKQAVHSIIYRFTGDRNESEDVAQETFIKAFRYLNSFDTKRPFSTWLLKIANNCAYDHLQKLRKRNFESLDRRCEMGIQLKDAGTTPEEKAVNSSYKESIQEALKQLPDSYREILILRFVEDLSYAEIAEILDIPMSSVKVTLHRAKLRLADTYKEMENHATR